MKHQVVDQRSLDLHRLIAEKIQLKPELIQVALANISRYLSQSESSTSFIKSYREWEDLIKNNPLEEVLILMTEQSEEGQRLRQSSPFGGILTDEERMVIFGKYAPQSV